MTLKKKKTKQCHREFRYHPKKLTQCSKFQHPEVISLNRHCKIQTRNFYKDSPLQNNSQRRPWKRTEVAHMQTLPRSEKWVTVCRDGGSGSAGVLMTTERNSLSWAYTSRKEIDPGTYMRSPLIQVHAWEVRWCLVVDNFKAKFSLCATNAWVLGSWQRSYPSWQTPENFWPMQLGYCRNQSSSKAYDIFSGSIQMTLADVETWNSLPLNIWGSFWQEK
jgi:hypothetical protein